MTDWRRKAAEERHFELARKIRARFKSELEKHPTQAVFQTENELARMIAQAEPERKGLEECAREIGEAMEEFYLPSGKRSREAIYAKVLPILRTLAPEAHIEAALDELEKKLHFDEEFKKDLISCAQNAEEEYLKNNQSRDICDLCMIQETVEGPIIMELRDILRKYLREAPEPAKDSENIQHFLDKFDEMMKMEDEYVAAWDALLPGVKKARADISSLPAPSPPECHIEAAAAQLVKFVCPVDETVHDRWEKEFAQILSRHLREAPEPSEDEEENKYNDEETYPQPEHGWTCFHCGETFKKPGTAREHFGELPGSWPACQGKKGEDDETRIRND